MEELIRDGRMTPAGLKVYESRNPAKSGLHSFERESAELTPEMVAEFQTHPDAWAYFQSQPPGYRKLAAWYILSAKQDSTRQRRLQTLITDSASHQRLAGLRPPDKVPP